MKEVIKKQRTVSKATVKKMGIFNLINNVVEITNNANEILPEEAKPYITELQSRLKISDPYEVSFLCAFVDSFDEYRVRLRDIAKHYDVRPTKLLEYLDMFNDLVKRKVIRRYKDHNGEVVYRLAEDVLEGLRKNSIVEPKPLINLNINEFVDEIDDILERARENGMETGDIELEFNYLIENNQNLYLAQKLKGFGFGFQDLMLLLCMMILFVNNNDDQIQRHDLDDWFEHPDLRHLFYQMENETSSLVKAHLVEATCIDGQVLPGAWKLTDFCKEDILQELKLVKPSQPRSNLTHHEDIKEKKLFYNNRVTKEVNKLHDLLDEERMKRVLKRMDDKGMRKGFTCIFYGGPGTGKTETVFQLARESKRDIMLVDVPNIRSKWVGDTEKNIKRVFDQYKKIVKENCLAPILVFNEADAILTRRNEGCINGVDKMENAMQNIILQEMENLEGIMIATTNLTGNLDPAFERRFLYKIEFDKPTADERQHIWKAMLPDLTDDQAYNLAKRFDFSGGQIENIARKRIVNDILDDRDEIDIDGIIEACEMELLNKKNVTKLGFVR